MCSQNDFSNGTVEQLFYAVGFQQDARFIGDAFMGNLCRVVFEPMGIVIKTKPGESLLDIASDNKIPIRSECGGKRLCGKCIVAVDRQEHLSELSDREKRFLKEEQIRDGYRLACQPKVQGDVAVTIPRYALDSSDADYKTGVSGVFTLDPLVQRLFLCNTEKMVSENKGATDIAGFFSRIMQEKTGNTFKIDHFHPLRFISMPFVFTEDITLVNHREKGVTAVVRGDKRKSLGVAIDIGTTTLGAYLCDLVKGKISASAATANPQRRYGEDVISRISYANENEAGMEMLGKSVVEGINMIIDDCLHAVKANNDDIDEVVVVGNTTMQQAFAGIHINSLGFAPYHPVSRVIPDMTASDLGLDLNPGTNVHFSPMVSGFVGGDTMGVIIAESPHKRDEISLIIDIGTNGEIVLGNKKGLWVTSCATGPALEGAHIECGMRASAGAISRLSIDPVTYKVSYESLGNRLKEIPRGLCGSAIIDAAAEMLRAGIMLPNGRLKEGMPGVVVDENGVGRRYTLIPAENQKGGKEIYISLNDVRQIQLAKGALYSGIKLLMKRAQISHIDRMVLTGAFGARFDWRNGVAIGMLPEAKLFSRVEVVENAAGLGAIKTLMDGRYREEANGLITQIKYLELAQEKDFPAEFAMAMTFPRP